MQSPILTQLSGLQAVRPKMQMAKTLEDAAIAVDDMLNVAFQSSEGELSSSRIPVSLMLTKE
jgi:hypothetical protein